MKNRKGTHMRAARICSSESSPNYLFLLVYQLFWSSTRSNTEASDEFTFSCFLNFLSRKNNEMENTTIHCLPRTTFLFQNFIGKFFCDPRNLKYSSFLCLRKTINKADL